jgi:hypothetical protein
VSKLKKLAKDLPPAQVTTAKPKGENITISTVLPKAIIKQMKVKAAQEDKTIRVIILEALAQTGFTVDPAELVDKRK